MTSSRRYTAPVIDQFRQAGSRLGLDLAGLFEEDDNGQLGLGGFVPQMRTSSTSRGRGYGLTMKPQQKDPVTTEFALTPDKGASMALPTQQEPAEEPKAEEPKAEPAKQLYVPHSVTYSTDYMGNLSSQEAVGKANQLLARALGPEYVGTQDTYNKLFEPLYKNLQTGDDYGTDIAKFYEAARAKGFEPYSKTQTDISAPASQGKSAYGQFVNTKFGENFYDPADFGRRILEGKAFYRPGGEQTNLTDIGLVQNRIEAGEGSFWGKDKPYESGYRAASFVNKSDPFKMFFENYLAGTQADPEQFKKAASTPSATVPPSAGLQASLQADPNRFADYDFASQGEAGFGMKDVKYLLGEGASYNQLKEIAKRAPGGQIGDVARQLLDL